jgi:hypothetical protein
MALGGGGGAPGLARRALGGGVAKGAVGLFSIGAIAAAAWMMKDSYVGSRDRIQTRQAELRAKNDYDHLQYGQGFWSGNPDTDKLAHRWFGLKQKGPWGIREKFDSFKIWTGSMFRDVLFPNIIPLGVGIAGLYGAGIKVHRPIVAAVRHAGGLFGPNFFPSLGRFLGSGLGSIGKGLFRLIRLPFSSLPAFGIGLGVLTLGSFFLKRFNDSTSGDGQRNFFRDEIYNRR